MKKDAVIKSMLDVFNLFYNNNESFKAFVDTGFDYDYKEYEYYIDGYSCYTTCGASRVCMEFCGEGIIDDYVLKVPYNVYGSRYEEHLRQSINEYENYKEIVDAGYQDFFTEIIEGPSINEVIPTFVNNEAKFYFCEKVDVNTERYDEILYYYFKKKTIKEIIEDYSYAFDIDLDEVEPTECDIDDAIWNIIYDYDSESKAIIAFGELGQEMDEDIKALIFSIGDIHDENVGFSNGKLKILDFGWHMQDAI